MSVRRYYQAPTNDDFGYNPEYVTQTQIPFGSEEPWDEMESMDWTHISELSAGDEVVHSYYTDALHRGATENVAEVWESFGIEYHL